MGYGILQSYEFSLRTELVDTEIHGILKVIGSHEDGLGVMISHFLFLPLYLCLAMTPFSSDSLA